tara:strand:- start:144933 stop:145850 length:918 start_codon:yes stop_codon:yes gene_type:complete
MIVNELYNGSGLGNQLWRYTVTRAIAKNNGYDYGIMSSHKFKAPNIMTLDFGQTVVGGSAPFEGAPPTTLPDGITSYYAERELIHPVYNCDCRLYDPNLASVPDNTKIDGNMESEKYLEGLKEEVREWLRIKDDKQIYDFKREDVCVLAFRGGEYCSVKDLFLPQSYWHQAMQVMLGKNPNMKFMVVTDDPHTAKYFFPQIPVHHYNTEVDWILIRNTRNIILANSSFAWLPTWINEDIINVVAPKYWGKYNVSDGFWAQGDSLTKGWEYLDRDGNLLSYEQCKKEKDEYEKTHPEIYGVYDDEK